MLTSDTVGADWRGAPARPDRGPGPAQNTRSATTTSTSRSTVPGVVHPTANVAETIPVRCGPYGGHPLRRLTTAEKVAIARDTCAEPARGAKRIARGRGSRSTQAKLRLVVTEVYTREGRRTSARARLGPSAQDRRRRSRPGRTDRAVAGRSRHGTRFSCFFFVLMPLAARSSSRRGERTAGAGRATGRPSPGPRRRLFVEADPDEGQGRPGADRPDRRRDEGSAAKSRCLRAGPADESASTKTH